jgi:hypothetical protein
VFYQFKRGWRFGLLIIAPEAASTPCQIHRVIPAKAGIQSRPSLFALGPGFPHSRE